MRPDDGAMKNFRQTMNDLSTARTSAFDTRAFTAHGRTFLTFIVGLIDRRPFAIPPGVSVDGLAAAFERPEFRHAVGEVLTTMALQRLIEIAPPAAPDIVLGGQTVIRAAPWDAVMSEVLTWTVHQRTVAVLAQLVFVGSQLFEKLVDDIDADSPARAELLALRDELRAEARVARAAHTAANSPLVWPAVLNNLRGNLTSLATIPPGR